MRVRIFLSACLVISACSGGGGGGGGAEETEVEPNNTTSNATDLGGAGSHDVAGNTCSSSGTGNAADVFKVTASVAGTVSLTLDWNEDAADEDLAVRFLNSAGIPNATQADTPPADISIAVTAAAEVVYVEVFCYAASPNGVSYSGTISVP